MLSILRRLGGARCLTVGESAEVIRAEIFSAERLEQHAESLAIAPHVTTRRGCATRILATLSLGAAVARWADVTGGAGTSAAGR